MGVLVFFYLLFSYLTSSDESDNSAPNYSSRVEMNMAFKCAENNVKNKLRSPSTAEFIGVFERLDHITGLGNNKYKIVSWVDSQNGFGGTMRTKFSCIITLNGDSCTCRELEFYE